MCGEMAHSVSSQDRDATSAVVGMVAGSWGVVSVETPLSHGGLRGAGGLSCLNRQLVGFCYLLPRHLVQGLRTETVSLLCGQDSNHVPLAMPTVPAILGDRNSPPLGQALRAEACRWLNFQGKPSLVGLTSQNQVSWG